VLLASAATLGFGATFGIVFFAFGIGTRVALLLAFFPLALEPVLPFGLAFLPFGLAFLPFGLAFLPFGLAFSPFSLAFLPSGLTFIPLALEAFSSLALPLHGGTPAFRGAMVSSTAPASVTPAFAFASNANDPNDIGFAGPAKKDPSVLCRFRARSGFQVRSVAPGVEVGDSSI
jgi:hypothetical protein